MSIAPTTPFPIATPANRQGTTTNAAAPPRTNRPYRHSRPVFDRQVRIQSEYARRLVSLRQFRPAMTALYGIDVILRLIATDTEADQFEAVIETLLAEMGEEMFAARDALQRTLEAHDLTRVRPRYTHPIELRVQVASPHIGAYTNLIVELDQLSMVIDTLWLSGLLSSKVRSATQIAWRNRLGSAGQRFIELHRYAYEVARQRGQREAVDQAAHEILSIEGEMEEEAETPAPAAGDD